MAQQTVVIDDNFEYVPLEKDALSYYYQPEKVDWHPIDALDFLGENNPEAKRVKLFAYYDGLYQSTPTVGINEILKPGMRDQFRVLEQLRPSFGFIDRPVWYRFKIKYEGREPTRKLLLNIRGYLFDSQFFTVHDRDHVLTSFRNSYHVAKELKNKFDNGIDITSVIELSSEKREIEVYFKVYTQIVPHDLQVELHAEEHLEQKLWESLPFQWTYIGATVALLIYNFGIFLFSRQRIYLYYVLFVSTTLLLISEINGFYFNVYTENAEVFWRHHLFLSLGLHGIFFVAFAREFLPFEAYPRLLRLTGIAQAMAIAAAVAYACGPGEFVIRLGFVMISIVVPMIIVPAIWLMLKKEKQAFFYVVAFSTYLLGSFFRTLMIQGMLPSMTFLDHIMEIGSLVEALLLSIAMGDKLRTLNLDLKTYIDKVEDIVEEKTREIRSIMRHIHQGIFAIVPGVRIHEEYSRHLCEIVGTSDILLSDPAELLSEGSNLNDDDISRMKSAIHLGLNSPIEFALNESHLPREMEKRGRFLEVDWLLIENERRQTEKILVTLRDVTEVKKLRGTAAKHEKTIVKISEMLAVDGDGCQLFFESSHQVLTDIQQVLASEPPWSELSLRTIFLKYHTMKGHVRSMGFKELTNLVHKAENLCSLYQSDSRLVDIELLRADFALVLASLEDYVAIFREKLGRSASSSVSFNKDMIGKLLHVFQHLPPLSRLAFHEEEANLRHAYFKDLISVIRECGQRVIKTALLLGKPEPQFMIDSPQIGIPPQTVELLQNILVHLLGNSVDHGLETAPVRVAKGKPAVGLIRITVSIQDETLILMVGDDGQGLNIKQIREKALAQGMIGSDCYDPKVIAMAIFGAGFSTASHLSEISGRGMGLDAARSMLDGAIGIVFEEPHNVGADSESAPFHLRLELPKGTWTSGFDSGIIAP
ncbi:MAG TPA: 7TM diverse intracellular signaling domain-containing protein [Oligoflexus sp.]|uniref:7TM diverse intracellular signaling domain-containing protein n=1 Tax=Oligoflexus sp. TaxID=1971216 RepID=UPI002D335880|nr:7TM diverse intracellular signaling domain-containing protein [Oligoflexus sp.]HYX38113.1 7TM diverse intracellular signaling domain-containing protein [Oligoflexus sp.]